MPSGLTNGPSRSGRITKFGAAAAVLSLFTAASSLAQEAGGEATLKLPDLSQVKFLGRIDGHTLLLFGILFCLFGLGFGLTIYSPLKNLPVHKSMLDISALIYDTCKTSI